MERFSICNTCDCEIGESDMMISRSTCPSCRTEMLAEFGKNKSDFYGEINNADMQNVQTQQKRYRHVR